MSVSYSFAQCNPPMSDDIFSKIHAGVAAMQEGREQAIRDISSTNCLSTNQIKLFTILMPNDFEKYNYLIFANPYCSDPQHYISLAAIIRDASLRQQFVNNHQPGFQPAVHQPTDVQYSLQPIEPQQAVFEPQQPIRSEPVYVAPHSPINGYNGRIGCAYPMDSRNLNTISELLSNESFESNRLKILKQQLSGQCLSVEQLALLLDNFSFESNKLDIVKSRLENIHDLDNYLALLDLFSFDSNKRDIESHFSKNSNRFVSKASLSGPADIKNANYLGTVGCPMPLNSSEFDMMYSIVSNESFDSKKTNIVRNSLRNNCLSVDQIESLAKLFSFDSQRLDFLKFVYGKTYDLDNFQRMESLFSFDSNKRDFRKIFE